MLLMLSVHPSRQADLEDARAHHLRSSAPGGRLPRRVRQHVHADHSRRPACLRFRRDFVSRQRRRRTRSSRRPSSTRSRICRTTCWSSCWAAAIATPTSSRDMAWSLFGNTPPGWGRVQAICDYVHDASRFGYQHAALDAHRLRRLSASSRGVCRDFAHLAITLCRCMNIPARYCTGYLGDIGVPPVRARWISAPGSRSSSAGAGTRSTRATTRRALAGS